MPFYFGRAALVFWGRGGRTLADRASRTQSHHLLGQNDA